MKICPSDFLLGNEVDCMACVRVALPSGGTATGRASIRQQGLTYQAYLKLHPPHGRPFGELPRVEVVVYETQDLPEMIAWTNQTWGLEDTAGEDEP